jgi:hypothetical protein
MSTAHSEMCTRAVAWLKSTMRCGVVLSELAVGVEVPDAIGWKSSGSFLVECKVTRKDFLSDRDKRFRRYPEEGLGQFRYFMVPDGIVSPEEVPDRWGLLYLRNGRVCLIKKPEAFKRYARQAEILLLAAALRRTQRRIDEPIHTWLRWG